MSKRRRRLSRQSSRNDRCRSTGPRGTACRGFAASCKPRSKRAGVQPRSGMVNNPPTAKIAAAKNNSASIPKAAPIGSEAKLPTIDPRVRPPMSGA